MDTICNPTIPFCNPLPHPLQPGTLIQIRGTVGYSPTCFSINLQSGVNTVSRSDVALHLSPVFNSPPRLVRNSIQNQQWGPEESHGSHFPFAAGQEFEIFILVESEQFKIAVNGQHFAEFRHRLPLHTVSHISVDGDVTINTIKFNSVSTQGVQPQDGDSVITRPLGFLTPDVKPSAPSYNMPPISAYGSQSVPYPTADFGPPSKPPSSPYGSQSNPYGPPPSGVPYGPPSGSPYGPSSPSSPYGPPPTGSPYGPSSPNAPYGPPPPTSPYGAPPGGYPGQGSYPGPYQSQPGPYPGTTVVYPEQDKNKGMGSLGSLATGAAAALAGAAGSAMMMGKGKHKKHGYGHSGLGVPGSLLAGGVGSLLSPGHKQSGHSSPIPIGGAVAGGAAALAGAYMLSKSPIGKVMKPKKMKKLYKHKHKLKHGFKGWGSSSSSSSSEEE